MYDENKLNRFLTQQEGVYNLVVEELKMGEKRTHWIWFIFPQLKGLGFSQTSMFYGVENLDEARSYFSHPVLGRRLIECCQILMKIQGRRIEQILPPPDSMKLRSSMTLFSLASPKTELFNEILLKYFNGAKDQKTLRILGL